MSTMATVNARRPPVRSARRALPGPPEKATNTAARPRSTHGTRKINTHTLMAERHGSQPWRRATGTGARRRSGASLSREALRAGVHVERLATHETAQEEPALAGELDGERRRRPHCHEPEEPGHARLLHELERRSARKACVQAVGSRGIATREQERAERLVHRVVATYILAHHDRARVGSEERGRVESACALEGMLGAARGDRSGEHRLGRERRRTGRRSAFGCDAAHELESPLPAHSARGGEVEAPLAGGIAA